MLYAQNARNDDGGGALMPGVGCVHEGDQKLAAM